MHGLLSSRQTEKPVPITLHGGHFVDRHGNLGSLRRQESELALGKLGVQADHLGLPDGRLYATEHQDILTDHIVTAVRQKNIRAIATLGLNGFCGHDDHVATHLAAMSAQKRLAVEDDTLVPILALNHNHAGELRIPVNPTQKLAALAVHESQFGRVGEQLRKLARYQPLFQSETYDIIQPNDF